MIPAASMKTVEQTSIIINCLEVTIDKSYELIDINNIAQYKLFLSFQDM